MYLRTSLPVTFILLALACLCRGGPDDNRLAWTLAGTTEHPRSSEGAFVTLRSGEVDYYYSLFSGGSSDFSPSQVAVIRSKDQGLTWDHPTTPFPPAGDAQEMSVSVLRLQDGRLALFSLIKHGKLECRPYVRFSEDDGAHWTHERALFSEPGYYILNNDRVIQMSDGRLVAPIAFHPADPKSDLGGAALDPRAVMQWYYSDDNAASWTKAPAERRLGNGSQSGLQEPGVVEEPDHSLFTWARTDQGSQLGCRSNDRGLSWSEPEPTSLASPLSPAQIKVIPGTSELLCIYNDYSGQYPFVVTQNLYSGRAPLVSSVSSDGGKTWEKTRLLEGDTERDYCYPSLHFVGEYALVAYWTSGEHRKGFSELRIRRLSLPWLTQPRSEESARAEEALKGVFNAQQDWQKIHAAEAVLPAGHNAWLRQACEDGLKAPTPPVCRVGLWRVLARTAPTKVQRDACIQAVNAIFLNPSSPDRSQAIETLCKLGEAPTGAVLTEVSRLAADPKAPLRPLCLWSLVLANEKGALPKLCELLKDTDPTHRLIAAYALRWLGTKDSESLAAVVAAVHAENPHSKAYPYLIGAAYALNASDSESSAWKGNLLLILQRSEPDASFEAGQALLQKATPKDLPAYAPLLDSHENDTRTIAAGTILYVEARG